MNTKRYWGAAAMVLALCLVFASCDTGDDGGTEEILEVTHVTGFQGKLNNGALIEIAVESLTDGNQPFTLYVNGVEEDNGTLTLSGGRITAIVSSTNSSLTYSEGVRYGGNSIPLRPADDTVWVHWGAYYGASMADFNDHARQYGSDAGRMYDNRPTPDEQGYYPSYYDSYDTPQNIYNRARADYPSDAPPISVLNQAIRVLNDHRNTGVGAYVSRGNLIAYYFRRVK
jgi:hypothetical protein